jgi:hypothetical protein
MVGAGAVGDLFGHVRHGVVGVHWHDGKVGRGTAHKRAQAIASYLRSHSDACP